MSKKILVVDDDSVIVNYLISIFKENGYETCSAADGVEAYEVLKNENPDLITLDLEMEEEWGTRFYRRLSKDKNFKEIPVIVISGLSGRHLALKNVVTSLSKPFDPDKLMAIVRKTLGEAD